MLRSWPIEWIDGVDRVMLSGMHYPVYARRNERVRILVLRHQRIVSEDVSLQNEVVRDEIDGGAFCRPLRRFTCGTDHEGRCSIQREQGRGSQPARDREAFHVWLTL